MRAHAWRVIAGLVAILAGLVTVTALATAPALAATGSNKPTTTVHRTTTTMVHRTTTTTVPPSTTTLPPCNKKHYGPCGCKPFIRIIPNPVRAGHDVTVIITGNCKHHKFNIYLHSSPVYLGSLTTDGNGFAEGVFLVPASVGPGQHYVEALDADGNSASTPVIVEAAESVTGTTVPTTPSTSKPLAFTGADIAGMTGGGAAVVLAGGLLVLAARKRRQEAGR